MQIASAGSTLTDPRAAIDQACADLSRQLGATPTIIFAHFSIQYAAAGLWEAIRRHFPACRVHGASSCRGVMTEQGIFGEEDRGLALLGLLDPDGAYGVAIGSATENPRQQAATLLRQAIAAAERPGEVPDLVRLAATPGREEEILLGIEDILGPNVPIIGGTAADNEIKGGWEIMADGGCQSEGLALAVLYPSTPLYFSFHNGYRPTEQRGTVTRAAGRTIYQIDHRPAAEVYNHWTGGLIQQQLAAGGVVLEATTLFPLGREVGQIGGVPYFNLAHPERVTAEGGLTTFADIAVGEELHQMIGTSESLITRGGRVAEAALEAGRLQPRQISGALVTYCAGCMLTVFPRLEEVRNSLDQALGGRPFLGNFTFGEQGCFTGGENRHGNLMISVIVFSGAKP
ncbi:MAG: FIST N-terminal domain-containing protein [Desulfurivibrio sp.]|nr:FIST N-terminal domain-containing protein [Desulfurivibrio sp.]